LNQIAKAMTKPVGVGGYASNNVYNEAAIMNDDIELGSDHPYEGLAGKPKFSRDVSSHAIMETGIIFHSGNGQADIISLNAMANYRLRVIDEPEQFPGSSSSPSQMVVEIAPVASTLSHSATFNSVSGFNVVPWYGLNSIRKSDLQSEGPFGDTWPGTSTYTPFTGSTASATTNALDGSVLTAAKSIIGQRMFIRRGGTVFFPGVVASVSKRLAEMANSTTAANGMVNSVSQTNGLGRYLDPDNANKYGTENSYFPTGAYGVGNDTGAQDVVANAFIVMPGFTGNENTLLDGLKIAEGTDDEITLDQTTFTEATCDTTDDATITHDANTNIVVGLSVTGAGIPLGARVASLNGSGNNSFELSASTSGGALTNTTLTFHSDKLLAPRSTTNALGTYEVFQVPHTPWIYTFTFEPGVTESPIDFGVLYQTESDNHYLAGPTYTGALGTLVESTGEYLSTSNSVATGNTNSRGLHPASESNCWGIVTSQADTNPKVLIKSVEVKRNKRVSFEG